MCIYMLCHRSYLVIELVGTLYIPLTHLTRSFASPTLSILIVLYLLYHRLYLVFELVDTDLKKFMDSNKAPLHPDLVQSYTCQIFEGDT